VPYAGLSHRIVNPSSSMQNQPGASNAGGNYQDQSGDSLD
jgi:hypothetical protein